MHHNTNLPERVQCMKNENIIRIKPAELEKGMILARDIVTDTGQLIVARETLAQDIPKSAIKHLDHIFVRVPGQEGSSEEAQDETPKNIPDKPASLESVPLYKNFKNLYDSGSEKTEGYISAICSGEDVFVGDLCEMPNKIMQSLANKSDIYAYVGEIKDKDLITHSNNVSLLCNLFGHWLDLNADDIDILTLAGLFHDIGKTRLSSDLLPVLGEPISERQEAAMRRHPHYGYSLLELSNLPEEVRLAALQHHERHDGTGYPSGLKSDQISAAAKIVQICNAYENALHAPPGEDKRCPFDIIRVFERDGYAVMDPKYLWIFLNKVTNSFLGHWVRLSDGRKAKVFFINQSSLSRPIVKLENGEAIDLLNRRDLNILNLL